MNVVANSHPSRGPAGDQLRVRLVGLLAIFLDRIAPWLLVIVSLVLVQRTIRDLTHSSSIMNAWLGLMGSAKVTRGFAFVFGLAGVVYGLQQRSLRRAEAARQEGRISELEKMVRESRVTDVPPGSSEP